MCVALRTGKDRRVQPRGVAMRRTEAAEAAEGGRLRGRVLLASGERAEMITRRRVGALAVDEEVPAGRVLAAMGGMSKQVWRGCRHY